MADKKISALTGASTPLAGTEVLPIVQSGATVKVAVSDLTAGRAVSASSVTATGAVNAGADSGISFSNAGGYVNQNVSNTSATGYARTLYNIGSGGANGIAMIGYVPGVFFRVGPVASDASTPLQLITNNSTVGATLDSSSNFTVNNGNLVIGTSGKGIDFSATSGSGTSELLADYEEGTFTPTIIGTTTAGTGTYSNQVGRYTKVGNSITCWIYLNWTAHTGTGDLRVSGLPVAVNASGWTAASLRNANIALTAGNVMQAYTGIGLSVVVLEQYTPLTGAPSAIPMDTSGSLVMTLTYDV
jgi:hypothetical protein